MPTINLLWKITIICRVTNSNVIKMTLPNSNLNICVGAGRSSQSIFLNSPLEVASQGDRVLDIFQMYTRYPSRKNFVYLNVSFAPKTGWGRIHFMDAIMSTWIINKILVTLLHKVSGNNYLSKLDDDDFSFYIYVLG